MLTDLLYQCYQTETDNMLDMLEIQLGKRGYKNNKRSNRWLFAPGDVPLCLVAHVDTVHMGMPTTICFDSEKKIIWSPTGLGADDRAGVHAILTVLDAGQRPSVLFTDEEETGGHGATDASYDMHPDNVRLLVQLDRRGDKDAVFYDCDNRKAVKYASRFGFQEASGTFTDISILMPAWGIAGVNLSVGYYGAHTTGEHLVLPEWERTVYAVLQMCSSPPAKKLKFHNKPRERFINDWNYGWKGMNTLKGWRDEEMKRSEKMMREVCLDLFGSEEPSDLDELDLTFLDRELDDRLAREQDDDDYER